MPHFSFLLLTSHNLILSLIYLLVCSHHNIDICYPTMPLYLFLFKAKPPKSLLDIFFTQKIFKVANDGNVLLDNASLALVHPLLNPLNVSDTEVSGARKLFYWAHNLDENTPFTKEPPVFFPPSHSPDLVDR